MWEIIKLQKLTPARNPAYKLSHITFDNLQITYPEKRNKLYSQLDKCNNNNHKRIKHMKTTKLAFPDPLKSRGKN